MRFRTRRLGRLFSVVCALALLLLLMPGGAAAASISPSAVLRSWDCHHNIAWQGSLYGLLGPSSQNKGTLDSCYYLYQLGSVDSSGRVQDGDPSYDTYVYEHVAQWTTTYNGGTTDNSATITLTSSISAVGGAYTADPNTISSSKCLPISVGASAYGIGISLSEILCNNATLTRSSLTASHAQWTGNNVVQMPRWDVAYMIKVNQGARPTFSTRLAYPKYTSAENGPPDCGGGRCAPTWTYTKGWWVDSWDVVAP